MLHPSAKLVHSRIEGKGLIARRLIPRGSIFWKLSPHDRLRKYSLDEYKKFSLRYRKTLDRFSYPEGANHIVYSLEDDRHWNHSCNANVLDDPDGEMCIVVRDVQPGEEITYDYGLNLREDLEIKCNCRSAHCRKTIRRLRKDSPVYKELAHKAREASRYKTKVSQPLLKAV